MIKYNFENAEKNDLSFVIFELFDKIVKPHFLCVVSLEVIKTFESENPHKIIFDYTFADENDNIFDRQIIAQHSLNFVADFILKECPQVTENDLTAFRNLKVSVMSGIEYILTLDMGCNEPKQYMVTNNNF